MAGLARSRRLRAGAAAALVVLAGGWLTACSSSSSSTTTTSGGSGNAGVLLVGTYNGKAGQYKTIQAAVNAAKPGNWILVAPGDYHESADHAKPPTQAQASGGALGGVLVETPNLHLRGMDRNKVIIDGDLSTAPSSCSASPKYQDLGVKGSGGKAYGRNGIVVYKANGVSVDNLTVCNCLAGSGDSGNGVWWNGGAGTGKVGMKGYEGSYLTATSTYFGGEKTAATYGIFSSNTAGPASWDQIYASNYNDSGAYVGACLQVCGIVINHAWFEYSALGYSGTNSGGSIVIKNSQFDNNKDGFDTNTQIGGDPPAPQNGACPNGAVSPITHTHSCWVFMNNYVHDNNNPNVPASGSAASGPTGTGMTVSGGTNDTVMNNRFANNGAWGILFIPYPDSSTPFPGQTCKGTGGVPQGALGCVYDPKNDALLHNTFTNNGFFKNPSNGDYGQIMFNKGEPQNCYVGNSAPDGSAPANLEQTQPTCGPLTTAVNTAGPLLGQVLCDTNFGSCPPGAQYPQPTKIVMHPLPTNLPTMPDPCAGVPTNAWCPTGSSGSSGSSSRPPYHGSGTPLALAAVGLIAAPVLRRRVRRARRS